MADSDTHDGKREDHGGAIYLQRDIHTQDRYGNHVGSRRTLPTRERVLATILQLHRYITDFVFVAASKHKRHGGTANSTS
jgi:hypothetical protein